MLYLALKPARFASSFHLHFCNEQRNLSHQTASVCYKCRSADCACLVRAVGLSISPQPSCPYSGTSRFVSPWSMRCCFTGLPTDALSPGSHRKERRKRRQDIRLELEAQTCLFHILAILRRSIVGMLRRRFLPDHVVPSIQDNPPVSLSAAPFHTLTGSGKQT